MASLNSNLQMSSCKYFMDQFDCSKPTLNENILENTVVDHLNSADTDLLNLLSTEEDCTAMLHNIAANEQFQRLISTESNFVHSTELDAHQNELKHVEEAVIDDLINGTTQPFVEEIQQKKIKIKPAEGFKCDQCLRVCSTKKLLKKHLLIHTKKRSIPCETCGKLFRHRYELTAHQKSHNNPTYKCDICSKMFIHKSHLNAHRKKHLGEYVAFCAECQIGFVSQTTYKTHRNTQHDKLHIICDICGIQLSTLSSLKEHKTTHDPDHGKERSHICDICGKTYLNARNLKSHMNLQHLKLKPYVCSVCGKSVSSKKILETHLKMHTCVKDFFCNICDKSFASKEYLTVHQRIHTGEKPFECPICQKSFTQKTSLTVHLRYHTGKKPYKCECGKEFTTKSHLMSHYKTHDVGGVEIEYITHRTLC